MQEFLPSSSQYREPFHLKQPTVFPKPFLNLSAVFEASEDLEEDDSTESDQNSGLGAEANDQTDLKAAENGEDE